MCSIFKKESDENYSLTTWSDPNIIKNKYLILEILFNIKSIESNFFFNQILIVVEAGTELEIWTTFILLKELNHNILLEMPEDSRSLKFETIFKFTF